MNVSLTPELEAMIRQQVDSGRYNNASEVVREALRLLDEHQRVQHLRSLLAVGLEQAQRGELVEFTPELVEDIARRAKERFLRGEEPALMSARKRLETIDCSSAARARMPIYCHSHRDLLSPAPEPAKLKCSEFSIIVRTPAPPCEEPPVLRHLLCGRIRRYVPEGQTATRRRPRLAARRRHRRSPRP